MIKGITLPIYCIGMLILISVAAMGKTADSLTLEIANDKISVQAHMVPLQEILQRIAYYGITVRIDPDLNPETTAFHRNTDLESGLKSLLKPLNHIFIWRLAVSASESPSVRGYLLDEIQIFKPGEKDKMALLETEEQIADEDTSAPDTRETQVTIKGNKVFVPVVIGYGDNQVETILIFDTGAGSIVLHEQVADRLGVDAYQQGKGRGVGGIEIDTRLTRLAYVKVGPHTKNDLNAAIVSYEGPPEDFYSGLLGMNFLKGLKFEIDFDRQVIRWGADQ